MESVSFGSQNYDTKYQKQEKQPEQAQVIHKKTPKDSFDKKYKQKKSTKGLGIAATIGLMAASAFAAYKGKDTIKGTYTALKTQAAKSGSNLKTKFPNMTQSLSYLKKACDTPLNAIKGFGKNIKNIFTKAK